MLLLEPNGISLELCAPKTSLDEARFGSIAVSI